MGFRIIDLPPDILDTILGHLDAKSVCKMAGTCREFRKVIQDSDALHESFDSGTVYSFTILNSLAVWIQRHPNIVDLKMHVAHGVLMEGTNIGMLHCALAFCASTLRTLTLHVETTLKNPSFLPFMTRIESMDITCHTLYADLTELRRLKHLRVCGKGWHSFLFGFPESLRSLELNACGFRHIPEDLPKQLATLVMDNNPLYPTMPHLPHLKSLSLKKCGLLEIPEVSKKCPGVRYLDLSYNSLTGWEEHPTFDALMDLHSLETLNLSHNALDVQAVRELDFLKKKPRTLNVAGNLFLEPEWGPYMNGVEHLIANKVSGAFLKRCKTLKCVSQVFQGRNFEHEEYDGATFHGQLHTGH